MSVHGFLDGLGAFYKRYLVDVSQLPVRWGSCRQRSREYVAVLT